MVSLLIGSKGKQISSIMKSSKAEIVVNQPIHKMKHRTVKVEGFLLKLIFLLNLFENIKK